MSALVNNIIKTGGLVVFLFLMFIAGCEKENRNIKDFYFPLASLEEGLIYEYHSINNQYDPPFFWLYQTKVEGDDLFLTGTYFGPDFSKYQSIREEVVSNGMLLDEFRWYEKDTTTNTEYEVPVEVHSGNVFSFELTNPPSVLVSSIHWTLPTDTLTKMTFIRNRQFEKDTTYTFANQSYDCLKFYVRELIDNERQGHLEQEYEAAEIYAKGIGLVYFRKDIAKEWQMEYELKEIHEKAAFEEKYQFKF